MGELPAAVASAPVGGGLRQCCEAFGMFEPTKALERRGFAPSLDLVANMLGIPRRSGVEEIRRGLHATSTMDDERAAVKRWLAGQRASAQMQRALQATEGAASGACRSPVAVGVVCAGGHGAMARPARRSQ